MSFEINWEKVNNPEQTRKTHEKLSEKMKSLQKPDFLGEINISSLKFGEKPKIRFLGIINTPENVKKRIIEQTENSLEMKKNISQIMNKFFQKFQKEIKPIDFVLQVSADLSNVIEFTIETELVVNWPTPKFISLPIKLTVKNIGMKSIINVVVFNEKMGIYLDSDEDANKKPLEMEIQAAIGDQSKGVLQNLEKVQNFMVEAINTIIKDKFVFPNIFLFDEIISEKMK
ncbi:distribution and morphology protein [Anaeramoeba ignava]|uniref:Distribution and morphology protein n=1 Tax=Anaeramoeba ignava TaxID=1746090 RepID=A0A9Q0LGD3_ANAIG|nr:distribution and morphology protein [Anaeramoeba ignava]